MADKMKSKLGITYTITKVKRKGPGGTKNYLPYRVTSSNKGYLGSWQTKTRAKASVGAFMKIDAGGAKNIARAGGGTKSKGGGGGGQ